MSRVSGENCRLHRLCRSQLALFRVPAHIWEGSEILSCLQLQKIFRKELLSDAASSLPLAVHV